MRIRFIGRVSKNGAIHEDERLRISETFGALVENGQTIVTGGVVLAVPAASIVWRQPGSTIAIVGSVYSGLEGRRLETLTDALGVAACQTRGASILRDLWGRYVAFVIDETNGRIDIVRDPSMGVPCYRIGSASAVAIASDLDLLLDTDLCTAEIDWAGVCDHLRWHQLRGARTCINGVQELLGGERLSVAAGVTTCDAAWSPWTFAARDARIEDWDLVTTLLHETVQGCVLSVASDFAHPLVSISGGLDSSLIVASLAARGGSFSCVTIATRDPAGDERCFARQVAHAAGVRLFEAFEDIDAVDLGSCDGAHLPRPIARAFAQSADRIQAAAAKEVGADVFMNGAGGDNVFCFLRSAAPIADRLLVDGLSSGVWRTSRDMGSIAQVSTLRAALKGCRRAFLQDRGFVWRGDERYLSESALATGSQLAIHPWLEPPRDALPGKAGHIAAIMNIHNHVEGFRRELTSPVLAPLLSQPLLELCLRIPTWTWCRDGRDRAPARSAFAAHLPAAIAWRRSKGSPTGFASDIWTVMRRQIATLLLEGELAQRGLVQRAPLEAALSLSRPVTDVEFLRVMQLLDVEMWLVAMSQRRQKRASAGVERG